MVGVSPQGVKLKYFRIKPEKCRVIFFDLEFYVPLKGREREGFCYNPWDKGSKLLGGSFLVANPEKDLKPESVVTARNIKSFWLWESNSEKELLEKVYVLLKKSYDVVYKAHDGKVSPILCGIGISSSDVPILFELFKRYKILSNAEAFYFQNKFRVIDISQLSIATFNNNSNFIYPKQKKLILQKYMPGKKFESGKSVWGLYDEKNYEGIKARVIDEVLCTHHCYMKVLEDFRNFKKLEKNKKRFEKLLNLQEAG